MIKSMWKRLQDRFPIFGKKQLNWKNELEDLSSLGSSILRFQPDKPSPLIGPYHQGRYRHCTLSTLTRSMILDARRYLAARFAFDEARSPKVRDHRSTGLGTDCWTLPLHLNEMHGPSGA